MAAEIWNCGFNIPPLCGKASFTAGIDSGKKSIDNIII
jgi:hypothetical protein